MYITQETAAGLVKLLSQYEKQQVFKQNFSFDSYHRLLVKIFIQFHGMFIEILTKLLGVF